MSINFLMLLNVVTRITCGCVLMVGYVLYNKG